MSKRFKLSGGKSRKMFRKGASMTNSRNLAVPRKTPMRGGIRL